MTCPYPNHPVQWRFTVLERYLHCNGLLVRRIVRIMPTANGVCSYYEAICSSQDPSLIGTRGESDMCEAGKKDDESMTERLR